MAAAAAGKKEIKPIGLVLPSTAYTHNSSIQAFVFVKTHKKFEKANTIS